MNASPLDGGSRRFSGQSPMWPGVHGDQEGHKINRGDDSGLNLLALPGLSEPIAVTIKPSAEIRPGANLGLALPTVPSSGGRSAPSVRW